MGCTLSRRQFEVNPNIEGQDQAALNVMYELGLSKRDIDVMYTAFWDMDADESGTVHFWWQIIFILVKILRLSPLNIHAAFERFYRYCPADRAVRLLRS